jgi:hypothetical protein
VEVSGKTPDLRPLYPRQRSSLLTGLQRPAECLGKPESLLTSTGFQPVVRTVIYPTQAVLAVGYKQDLETGKQTGGSGRIDL